MTYINSAQGGDDATTYKGKIDESLNLLREPPVTGGSGSAYTVADWSALTFANDTVYYAKAHTANTGACTIDSLSIVNLDSSALAAGQIQQNHVMKLLYQSSGTKFLLLNPSSKTLTSPTINGGALSGTFTGDPVFSGILDIQAETPTFRITENDQTSDNANWDVVAAGGQLRHRAVNDARTASSNWVTVSRSGTTITTINLQATNVQANGVNVSTNSTSSIHTVQQIELGHASNTTISSPGAGRAQIEGREIVTATASATQLTATIDELNKNDDSAAAVSNFESGMRHYFYSGDTSIAAFDVDANITENTFESLGPTGSGATNIYTEMDVIPDGAVAAIFTAKIYSTADGVGQSVTARILGRKTGSTANGNHNILAEINYEPNGTAQVGNYFSNLIVPLDSSKRCDITWFASETANDIALYLTGFVK